MGNKTIQNIIDVLRGKKCITIKKKEGPLLPLHKPYTAPQNTYEKIICTRGFGHSGSGVILDLLAEFDNTTVIGAHDANGNSPLSQDKNVPKVEVDFFRRYGGVMDLENAFQNPEVSPVHKLLNFITLSEFYFKQYDPNGLLYNDKYLELTYEFVEKLTEAKIEMENPLAGDPAFVYTEKKGSLGKDYSNLQTPYFFKNKKKRFSYFLKDLSVKEYRALAKEYMKNVFNLINSKEYLVLDQFTGLFTDFEKCEEYIGDFKLVIVYRDPRDVYITGILLNASWIPKDPKDFVLWYKNSGLDKCLKLNDPHACVFRFEDLVLDYDNTIPKVIEFLGLKKENHIAPKTQFRPEFSKKNIGLWRNHEDQKAIDYIYNELKDYTFGGAKPIIAWISSLFEVYTTSILTNYLKGSRC